MNRLKKIGKWTAIVAAAAIAMLLVLNAVFVWSTGTRLERRLLELRQSGDPVQLSDLAREPIPPEQNADVYLRRAADDLDAIHNELLAMYPKTAGPEGALSAGEKEKLDTLFSAYPRLMPLLEQAADCPDYDPQIDGTLPTPRFVQSAMDRTGKHRLLARVLRARMALLIANRQLDGAVANQVLLLRLARHWRREPLLFGYLITSSCEQTAMTGVNQVLQTGAPSSSARQALEAELALHDTMEGYTWAVRSERSCSLSTVRDFPMWGYWLLRGFGNDLELRLIELFDRYIELARKPFADVWTSNKPGGIGRGGLNPYGALVTLLEPSLSSVREPAERVRAMSRCLRVLNAIQARVAPGSDRAPQLADLGLPQGTTVDPYNGEPLHVKKLPEGWLVYSVGLNLADDGGTLDKVADVGFGPIKANETPQKP